VEGRGGKKGCTKNSYKNAAATEGQIRCKYRQTPLLEVSWNNIQTRRRVARKVGTINIHQNSSVARIAVEPPRTPLKNNNQSCLQRPGRCILPLAPTGKHSLVVTDTAQTPRSGNTLRLRTSLKRVEVVIGVESRDSQRVGGKTRFQSRHPKHAVSPVDVC